MTIPSLPALDRTSPTFRADLDALFLSQLPATTGAFNTEIERINAIGYGSYNATSTTSLTIGTGSKSLTVETNKGYVAGQAVLIASTATPTNYMAGNVTSYDSGTGALVLNATASNGSGTLTAWTVSVTAMQAALPPTVLQRTITGADTLIAADQGKLINASGTFTLAVTAAATLGNGWYCWLRNTGTGTVTLDPNGAETVDGVATGPVRDTILLVCNGTGFTANKIGPFSRLEVLTSGTSWVCPLGVRRVRVRGVGGGGGGGRAADDSLIACAGSGAGYFEGLYSVSPATAYVYAIGALGAAATTGNSSGSNGGSTSITIGGVSLTASGGYGGSYTPYTISGGAASGGQINIPGKAAFSATTSGSPSAMGGDTPLGFGGVRVGSGTNAAVGYGSGGYGGINSVAAGDGRPGAIILEY